MDDEHDDHRCTRRPWLRSSSLVTKNLAAATPARVAEVHENPGFGVVFTDHMVDICWSVKGGWHRPRVQPYGPIAARPRGIRAALRAGDLRGHQGLPSRRRLDPHVPPRPQRGTPAGQRPAPRAAGAADRVLHPVAARARRGRRSLGALRRRPEPVPASVHVRQGGLPRRPRCAEGRLLRDREPAGRVLHRRREAGAHLALRGLRPCRQGGTGKAKTGGNYASSLLRAERGEREGLRPGRVPRRERATSRSSAA